MTEQQSHYWERCRRGAAPLLIGAIGLAGLGATQLVPVRHQVESDLQTRSRAALSDAGFTGVHADFTGQDGVLRGTVSSAADVERALGVVRRLEGVRIVRSELQPPGNEPTLPNPTLTTATPVTTAPTVTTTPTATPSSATTPAPSPAATAPPPVTATLTAAEVRRQLEALPPIRFGYESTQLSPSGRQAVARAAAVLRAAPGVKVRVEGFTDNRGDWDVNLAVSKARAKTVRATLIASGVPAAQLTAVGFSEERPRVPNTTRANRALNRRVELTTA